MTQPPNQDPRYADQFVKNTIAQQNQKASPPGEIWSSVEKANTKDLMHYVDLSEVKKQYNTKYKRLYPELSKTEAVQLCKQNNVPLFDFKATATIRERIYVERNTDLASLRAVSFQEVNINTDDY